MIQPTDQQLVAQLAGAIRDAATSKPPLLTFIPAASAAIALASAIASIWLTRSVAREARGHKYLPVIVFYRRRAQVWILKNVGEGTALNVSITNYENAGKVKDQIELYPVAPGQEIRLDYLQGADKLVAAYVNVF